MQLTITARHLKLTSAITDYVQKKLEKAKRFLDHLIWAQVVLDVVKLRHAAEIIIHAGWPYLYRQGRVARFICGDRSGQRQNR